MPHSDQAPGGRGSTAVVRSYLSPEVLYVIKGVAFGTISENRTAFLPPRDVCYHEIWTISSLPKYPSIIPPLNTFVTVSKIGDSQQAFICCTLYLFMEHSTLDDQVQAADATRARLPLTNKAAWCLQMFLAVSHVHCTAHSFHMDINPANFLLNSHKDLVLVD